MNIQEENLFCVSLASQFWVMAGIWRLINSYGQTALHSQCLSLVSVALSNKECTLPYHQLSEVFTPVIWSPCNCIHFFMGHENSLKTPLLM